MEPIDEITREVVVRDGSGRPRTGHRALVPLRQHRCDLSKM